MQFGLGRRVHDIVGDIFVVVGSTKTVKSPFASLLSHVQNK